MVSLEQVKLLESKVTKTIDYVKKVTEENTGLKEKLDSYQKRIDELENLIQRFKEDQSRIEDGILSALDRLNQFEDALESRFSKAREVKLPAESKLSGKKDTPEQEEVPPAPATEPEPLPPQEEDNGSNGELDIF